jgi:predicted Fe-Mo cluster-binding NifX family protein
MLAIPVLRSRVAPVLNWCSKILIIPRHAVDAKERLQLTIESTDPFEILRTLKSKEVSTLICGALTSDLLSYGEQLGLTILYGVAGELDEVIEAYRQNQLDQPQFRLPGCDGPYRKRRKGKGTCCKIPFDQEGSSLFTGLCVCPRCLTEVPHERGVPCYQVICPTCEQPMTRKKNPRSDSPCS